MRLGRIAGPARPAASHARSAPARRPVPGRLSNVQRDERAVTAEVKSPRPLTHLVATREIPQGRPSLGLVGSGSACLGLPKS